MAMVTHFLKEGSTLKELGLDGAEALDVEDLFPWIQDQISQQHTESDEYDTDLEEGPVSQYLGDSIYVYKAACKRHKVLPLSQVLVGLESCSLILPSFGLAQNEVKVIALALVNNISVTSIDLSENYLGCDGARCLAEALLDNRYVTSLNLRDTLISSGGIVHICHLLEENHVIKHLNLSGNDLYDRDAVYIANAIQKNESLTHLNLSHNGFRQQAGIILSSVIADDDCLVELDLSWNHLRLQGAVCIAEALQDNKTLETLNISWNGFGNEGGRAIGRALIFNTTLSSLDLSCNRVNLEGALGIAEGLRHNKALKVLKLNRNPITTVGACRFLQVYHTCSSSALTHLYFLDIAVDRDFEDLLDELEDRQLQVFHGGHVSNKDPYANRKKKKKTTLGDPLSLLMEYVKQNSLRLWDMFAQLDKDNSQSVSRKEFKNGMKEAKVPLTDDQIEKLMDKLDDDKNGEISFDELLEGQKRYRDRERRKRAAMLPALQTQSATLRSVTSTNIPTPRIRSATMSMTQPLGDAVDNLSLHLPSLRLHTAPAAPVIKEASDEWESVKMLTSNRRRKIVW